MILKNRLFERISPNREAKSIYIFSEGAKREYQYFDYFKELDSRINLEVYRLHPHEDNSPLGLLNIAKRCIIPSESNPNPKYNFLQGDEVWIVLDIDLDKDKSRIPQIEEVQKKCNQLENWNLVRSNPCFEVWLYYHIHQCLPEIEDSNKCSNWKQTVNESIKGGFDSRRHPIYISNAIKNSVANFEMKANIPDVGATEVFHLANSIVPLVETKLEKALKMIE